MPAYLLYGLLAMAAPSAAGPAAERPPAPTERLALDRQLGQMMMATVNPKTVGRVEDWIRSGRIGGVLLRTGGLAADQVRVLTARLQSWASGDEAAAGAGAASKLASAPPLLIAVDNEGGPQFTLRSMGLTVFPSNMARGATYSDMYAFLAAFYSAKELRSIGITMNFAPVLDVNTNPENPIIGLRSFGSDPEEVADLGAIAVEGARRGRVAAVAKHFPGHGDTARDSHRGLPVISHGRERLERVELAPFRAAIEAGVPAIMSAHIAYPALDPSGVPATLSKPILTGLLREEMGFDGVIVTDSLDMKAITERWTIPEAAVKAARAGADLLLIGSGSHARVFDALVAAVEDGRLSEDRVEASSRRILALKRAIGIGGKPLSDEEHRRIYRTALKIAERSVTVLEDAGKLLPLKRYKKPRIVLFMPPSFFSDAALLRKTLARRMPGSETIVLSPNPGRKAVASALKRTADADFLIVGTFHWSRSKYARQVAAVRKLLSVKRPAVLVSLMNPYDQQYFQATTRVAAYGVDAASMEALVRVLFGQAAPKGFLPVEVHVPEPSP